MENKHVFRCNDIANVRFFIRDGGFLVFHFIIRLHLLHICYIHSICIKYLIIKLLKVKKYQFKT